MANIKVESFTNPITQEVLQNKDFSFENGGNSSSINLPDEITENIADIKDAITKVMGSGVETAPILEAIFYTLNDIKNKNNQMEYWVSNIYNLLLTIKDILIQIKNNTDRI